MTGFELDLVEFDEPYGLTVPLTRREPMFADTLLSFQAFAGPQIAAQISPDPLGPTNRIIRLTRNGEPVGRAVLRPVPVGSAVSLTRQPRRWGAMAPLFAMPTYVVAVDGKPVLEVPESDLWPRPEPPKSPPWRSRVRRATKQRLRAWMDAGMLRIGYSPTGETSGDDW
jgi:hypothetical protein